MITYDTLKKSKFYERLIFAFKQGNLFLFPHIVFRKMGIKNNLSKKYLECDKKKISNTEDKTFIKNFINFVLEGTNIDIEFP